jgi:ATP-dependent Lon protease
LANEKDLSEIPEEFKHRMNFILVENLDEVFAVAFDKSAKAGKKSGARPAKRSKTPTAASAA